MFPYFSCHVLPSVIPRQATVKDFTAQKNVLRLIDGAKVEVIYLETKYSSKVFRIIFK